MQTKEPYPNHLKIDGTVAGFLFSFEKAFDYEKCIEGDFASWKTALYGSESKPGILSFHDLQYASDLFACSRCVSALTINQALDTLALTRSKVATCKYEPRIEAKYPVYMILIILFPFANLYFM